jgi:UDP:flavonoid glycosyltransferase YjiC (YdhE family)
MHFTKPQCYFILTTVGEAMKFVIAVHGTRGDIEPATAVALELQARGHLVTLAVPPNLIEFAGIAGVPKARAYGPDSQKQIEAELFRNLWRIKNPVNWWRQAREFLVAGWEDMGKTLMDLSEGADLILTGTTYQEVAANVAEARAIPFASLHYFPVRANNHILPVRLPLTWASMLWTFAEWLHWRVLKPADDKQRQELGLPVSTIPAARRSIERGALEIQAYDKTFFPGLEEQWNNKRPLVGSMTLALKTAEDPRVMSWIAQGSAPVYFGFGSMPLEIMTSAIPNIIKVCRLLGLRALVCLGSSPSEAFSSSNDVLFVTSANHAQIFPRCRAIVHHGGSGTTAASTRSGVPALVLSVGADQPVWARQVRRLGIGMGRSLASTTDATLLKDLETVLSRDCVLKARSIANVMTPSRHSVLVTADLLVAHANAWATGDSQQRR